MKGIVKKKFKSSNILITGGAGFVGSHIVENLLRLGANVTVLDNFSTGKRENLEFNFKTENLTIIEGNITNYGLLKEITYDKDYISHQSALTSVSESVKNPLTYHKVNVTGTLNLLHAAYKNNVKRVVLASSSAVYGKNNRFPQKESSENTPISPYAQNKLISEDYCKLYHRHYNLETICLRYFNVFGPRQSYRDEYAIVIPKFINCLLENESLPIFGDGNQSRDFIYIDNVVKSNLLALITQKGIGEVFNIGSGNDVSIIELSNILQEMLQVDSGLKFLPPREGDMRKTLADISKAKKMLGYSPEVPFEEGLKRTISWFKNYHFSNHKLNSKVE